LQLESESSKTSTTRIGYTFSQSSTSSQSPPHVTTLSGNPSTSTPLTLSSYGASPNTTLDRNGPTSSGVPIGNVKTSAQESRTTAAIAGGVVGGLLAAAIILFLLIWRYKRRRGTPGNGRGQTYNASHYGLKSQLFSGQESRAGSRLSDTPLTSGTVPARGLQISSPMPLMNERDRDPGFVNITTVPSPPISRGTGPAVSSETLVRARALSGHRPQLSYDSYAGDIRSRFPDPTRTVNGPHLVPNSKSRIIMDPRGIEYYSSEGRLGDAVTSVSRSSIASESLYSNAEDDIRSFEDVVIPSPMSTPQSIRPPRPIRTPARPSPMSKA